jgi:hypothetical protein
MKTCKDCGKEKSLEEFPSNNKTSKKTRCKPCYNLHTKKWRDTIADKEKLKKQWREASKRNYSLEKSRAAGWKKYGLSVEEYWDLYNLQRGRCKICRKHEDVLRVDHCHSTGRVRGLLCNLCNVGLGAFSDDVDRMSQAMVYLKSTAG